MSKKDEHKKFEGRRERYSGSDGNVKEELGSREFEGEVDKLRKRKRGGTSNIFVKWRGG